MALVREHDSHGEQDSTEGSCLSNQKVKPRIDSAVPGFEVREKKWRAEFGLTS